MNRTDLIFERPSHLQAAQPPEQRGIERDEVRLLVSTLSGHTHAKFHQLDTFLAPGDLLVVNQSATLPASLPAIGALGEFILNLSTHFGNGTWLAEPRWSSERPGPLPLQSGDEIQIVGMVGRLVLPFPGLPRLWFVQFEGDLRYAMDQFGAPIRYGYVEENQPLQSYQTLFAKTPGSAEMPSAARPFTPRVMESLRQHGVRWAGLVLHTGVSSLEVETEQVESHPMCPEPFEVPIATPSAVNTTRERGNRVIAVGTTVVRALEAAWDGEKVRPIQGYSRLFVHPGRGVHAVDGLLTGLHDPVTSHLAMLYSIGGQDLIQSAYREAIDAGYLWHEFGDSHLILP